MVRDYTSVVARWRCCNAASPFLLTFFSAHERSELILIAEGLVSVADGLSLMMVTMMIVKYVITKIELDKY